MVVGVDVFGTMVVVLRYGCRRKSIGGRHLCYLEASEEWLPFSLRLQPLWSLLVTGEFEETVLAVVGARLPLVNQPLSWT